MKVRAKFFSLIKKCIFHRLPGPFGGPCLFYYLDRSASISVHIRHVDSPLKLLISFSFVNFSDLVEFMDVLPSHHM